jgi:hypothetical protein
MSNSTLNTIVTYLILNRTKDHTSADFVKELGETSTVLDVYAAMAELTNTGHVTRANTEKYGKTAVTWSVKDSDENHAIALWDAYLKAND